MQKQYTNIIKLVSEDCFEEQQNYENLSLCDIGKDYLSLMTKKIIYFEFMKDLKNVDYVLQNLDTIIIQQIDLSNQIQLRMSIGKKFKDKDYKSLESIEPELKECIKIAIKMSENPNKKSGLFKSDTQMKNQITRGSINQSMKVQNKQKKETFLEDIKNQYSLIKKNIQPFFSNDESMQQIPEISQLKIQTQNSEDQLQLYQLIQSISKKEKGLQTDQLVNKFLKNIKSGNTAINHFIQHFGFNKILFEYQQTGNKFQTFGKIQFQHHLINNKNVAYCFKAIEKSKKKGQQRCSKQILSQALRNNPLLFKEFAGAMKKKGLKF